MQMIVVHLVSVNHPSQVYGCAPHHLHAVAISCVGSLTVVAHLAVHRRAVRAHLLHGINLQHKVLLKTLLLLVRQLVRIQIVIACELATGRHLAQHPFTSEVAQLVSLTKSGNEEGSALGYTRRKLLPLYNGLAANEAASDIILERLVRGRRCDGVCFVV